MFKKILAVALAVLMCAALAAFAEKYGGSMNENL